MSQIFGVGTVRTQIVRQTVFYCFVYFASDPEQINFDFQDVVAVKEAYEDVWTGLNAADQEDILNESIIRPEAILR